MYMTSVIESTDLKEKVIMRKEKLEAYTYNGFACILLPYLELLIEVIIVQILPDASLLFLGYLDDNEECA